MRKYNIISKNYKPSSDNQFINIDVSNLSQIINHSADTIYCECLEYLQPSQISSTIQTILEKIKPAGQVIFNIQDIKKYCSDIVLGKLSPQNLLDILKQNTSAVIIEDIYTNLDAGLFRVIQITKDNNKIQIGIQRINI